jgi:hypothetical protein
MGITVLAKLILTSLKIKPFDYLLPTLQRIASILRIKLEVTQKLANPDEGWNRQEKRSFMHHLKWALVPVFLLTACDYVQQTKGVERDQPNSSIRCIVSAVRQKISNISSQSGVDREMLVDIADRLCKSNFLTTKTYEQVKMSIQKSQLFSRSELLAYVQEDALKQLLGSNYHSSDGLIDVIIETKDEVLPKEILEKQRQEQQKLLDQLQATGILSDRVYNNLKKEIAAGQIQLSITLFSRAAVSMKLDEQLQPSRLDPVLEALQRETAISVQEHQSIIQAVEAGEINNPIQILNYISRATIIDFKKFSPDVNQYFLESYQAIASLLKRNNIADIPLTDFKVDIVEDKESSELKQLIHDEAVKVRKDLKQYISYNAVVTVTDQKRTYQQSGFYAKPETPNDFLGRLDGEQVVNLFNKILRDRQSAYRLYLIEAKSYDQGGIASDNSRFGVIVLTETQANAIGSDENFNLREQN